MAWLLLSLLAMVALVLSLIVVSLFPIAGWTEEAATPASLPAHCFSSATQVIERPLYPGQALPSFSYRFSLSPRENPDAPVLIFVPGGPGQASMTMPLGYPYEFAVVRIDPRGVGCNLNPRLPAESLTSEELARDILAVVRHLKPTRYFIHGISYGTIPATMAAALAESEGVLRPEAVILEGTIARPYAPDEYVSEVIEAWKRERAKLPSVVVERLSQAKLPFGYTSKEWAAYLSSLLGHGLMPTGVVQFQDELARLLPSASEDKAEFLRLQMRAGVAAPDEATVRVFREIACREFVPDVRDTKFDYDLVAGELVVTNERLCAGLPFDRPYMASRYQVQSPIYYFSGGMDPVTPPTHARSHFDSQKGPRVLVSIQNAGHHALSENLSDCAEGIWMGILAGERAKVHEALSSCALGSGIEWQAK